MVIAPVVAPLHLLAGQLKTDQTTQPAASQPAPVLSGCEHDGS